MSARGLALGLGRKAGPALPPSVSSLAPDLPRSCGKRNGPTAALASAAPCPNGLTRRQQQRCAPPRASGKGSPPSASSSLAPGKLVGFLRDGRLTLAAVTEPDGKSKFWVADARGHRSSLAPKSAALVLPGSGFGPADAERIAAAAAGADASLLEIAWAIAADGDGGSGSGGGGGTVGSPLTLAELASLLYDADGAEQQWMAYWLLSNDRVYFKQTSGKGGVPSYLARSQAAVEAAQAALEKEKEAEAARAAFVEAATAARAAAWDARPSWDQWVAGPHAARIKAIKEFAVKGDAASAATADLARESLGLLNTKAEPPLAWRLLSDLGAARLHDPLPLLRAGVAMEFGPELDPTAEALAAAPPPDPDAASRRDLTHLDVYTIDDAGTTEVDDGLSIESLPDGGARLWVHIADPTRWVVPGSPLDLEARARTRTLYLPFGTIPMFPDALSSGAFSLRSDGDGASSSGSSGGSGSSGSSGSGGGREGPVCCALSVAATLASDGSLAAYEITPSHVRVTHRLTYDEADADLALGPGSAQHEALQALYDAARQRKAWRAARGAIDIDLPEAKTEVAWSELGAPSPQISIKPINQWESAARIMVAEMMILAGEAAGKYGATTGLALPFRGQEAPQLPQAETLAALPDGPCRGYALRKCMTRSVMEPTPVPHASLALDTYVQVTSPIRRYSDMLAHWNIKAALRGQAPPFSAAQLTSILTAAGEAGRDLGRAENEVYKYFAAEFMRQHLNETFDATVLGPFRPESPLSAVLLEALGLETLTKLPRDTAPGERFALAPVDADPPGGFYRLSVVGELESAVRSARAAAEAAAAGEDGEEAAAAGDAVDMEAVWAMVDSQQQEQQLEGEEEAGEKGGQGAAAAASAAALAVSLKLAAALGPVAAALEVLDS